MAFDVNRLINHRAQSCDARVARSLLQLMQGGCRGDVFECALAPEAFEVPMAALKDSVDRLMRKINLAPFASVVEHEGKVLVTVAAKGLSSQAAQASIRSALAAAHAAAGGLGV